MSYQLFGRAIRAEYLSIGTLVTAGVVAYASLSGGKEPASSNGSFKETIQKAKEAVPLGAGSSEEEQFIKKFIDEEEKKAAHH